jgi:hypothetical protein
MPFAVSCVLFALAILALSGAFAVFLHVIDHVFPGVTVVMNDDLVEMLKNRKARAARRAVENRG